MLADPGNRTPAPGPLRAVQAFVNTLDIENGVDELVTPAELRAVLVPHATAGQRLRVGDADVRRARELRESLRRILLGNNGLPVSDDAWEPVWRTADAARLTLRRDREGRPQLTPRAHGVDAALGRLVAVLYDSMVDGSWVRLKACRRDVCHWVYYDRSKNRSSTWCAMSVCGNRTKVRRYRGRRKPSSSSKRRL